MKNKGSFSEAMEIGNAMDASDDNMAYQLRKANQRSSWWIGLIFAIAPAGLPIVHTVLNLSNEEVVSNNMDFFFRYLKNGDLLWLAITLSAMSFAGVLFFGIRRAKTPKQMIKDRVFLFVAAGLCIIFMVLYFLNIQCPMSDAMMIGISIICILMFGITSWRITFRISGEE